MIDELPFIQSPAEWKKTWTRGELDYSESWKIFLTTWLFCSYINSSWCEIFFFLIKTVKNTLSQWKWNYIEAKQIDFCDGVFTFSGRFYYFQVKNGST